MSHLLIHPSDGELAILRVLWTRSKSTVREVHIELSKERDVGYTTVLKLMQIMLEKRLVVRDASGRSHIYRAIQEKEAIQCCLLNALLKKAFGGSTKALVTLALTNADVTELDEIQGKIEELRVGYQK